MKSWVKILVVLIVVAVIVIFFIQANKKNQSDDVSSDVAAAEQVPSIAVDDIVAVQVVGMRSEYSLSRVSSLFTISGVLNIDIVNQEMIQQQLGALASLEPLEIYSDDVLDDDLGLGGYEILKVTLRDGRLHEFRLGDRTLTNNSRAVKQLANGQQTGPRFRISSDTYDAIMPMKKDLLKN